MDVKIVREKNQACDWSPHKSDVEERSLPRCQKKIERVCESLMKAEEGVLWPSQVNLADLSRYRGAAINGDTMHVLVLGGGPVGLLLCNMLLRTVEDINVSLVEQSDARLQEQILFINEELIGVNTHDEGIKQKFSEIMRDMKINACAFSEGLPPIQDGFCCRRQGEEKPRYFDTHHHITLFLREQLTEFLDANHVKRTELLKNVSNMEPDVLEASLNSLPFVSGNFKIVRGDTNKFGEDFDVSGYDFVFGCDGSNNVLGRFHADVFTRLKPLLYRPVFGYIVTATTTNDHFREVMDKCRTFEAPQHKVRFFSAVHGERVNLYVGCMFEMQAGTGYDPSEEVIDQAKERHFIEYVHAYVQGCASISKSRVFPVQPSIVHPVSGVSVLSTSENPLVYMLLGDASHGVNFFTGSGLNYGFAQVLSVAQMLSRLRNLSRHPSTQPRRNLTFKDRYKCCVWYSAVINSRINLKLIRGATALGGEYSSDPIPIPIMLSTDAHWRGLVERVRDIPAHWKDVREIGPAYDLDMLVQYWKQFYGRSLLRDMVVSANIESYEQLLSEMFRDDFIPFL